MTLKFLFNLQLPSPVGLKGYFTFFKQSGPHLNISSLKSIKKIVDRKISIKQINSFPSFDRLHNISFPEWCSFGGVYLVTYGDRVAERVLPIAAFIQELPLATNVSIDICFSQNCLKKCFCPFQAPSHIYRGHSSHVTNVSFLYDDSYLVSTGGKDMSVLQWRIV
ncbi:hypothetical protein XENORESO_000698 [Xenotaenia resolanae]|uniref:Uncharacterized protein n=1 Tax=Xenotaenia resolanae TaxID=208358 RepID=A0ABV0WP57_9TELE